MHTEHEDPEDIKPLKATRPPMPLMDIGVIVSGVIFMIVLLGFLGLCAYDAWHRIP